MKKPASVKSASVLKSLFLFGGLFMVSLCLVSRSRSQFLSYITYPGRDAVILVKLSTFRSLNV